MSELNRLQGSIRNLRQAIVQIAEGDAKRPGLALVARGLDELVDNLEEDLQPLIALLPSEQMMREQRAIAALARDAQAAGAYD